MSTYRPKGRPYYLYDFEVEGVRFHGSTKLTSKREAEVFEKRVKADAVKELEERKKLGCEPMTFDLAASKYWDEIGVHLRGDGPKNCLWSLEWLVQEIGAKRRLSTITDAVVAQLVAKRRGDKGRMSSRPVAPATVNRSVTEPLRKIMNRAESVWHEPVGKVNWKRHLLKEPKERVRELRPDEEARLFGALREDYHPILRFAIMTGVRLGEIYQLRWKDIDWGARTITIRGKGGKIAPIPMPPSVRELLWALREEHPEFVFTYQGQRGRVWKDGRETRKGQRYPITREGLKTAFRRALPDASVLDFRFHDLRHTTATRILRKTGNLKIAQKLLRHENIETTMRYAHVMHEDVLDAMEATIRASDGPFAGSVTQTPDESPDGADRARQNTELLQGIKKL